MTDGELRLLGALLAVRNAAVRCAIAPTGKRRDALVDAIEEADRELEREAEDVRRRRLDVHQKPTLALLVQTPPHGSRRPPRT